MDRAGAVLSPALVVCRLRIFQSENIPREPDRDSLRAGVSGKMFSLVWVVRAYSALAAGILVVHALFILWVVFGALVARSRPWLRYFHIACLFWGVLVELLPWPCPLTLLESWLEGKAGVTPYNGGFLLHYLDRLVYPDVSDRLLTVVGVGVCLLNLAIYARVLLGERRKRGKGLGLS
jgi:hypothetical protein